MAVSGLVVIGALLVATQPLRAEMALRRALAAEATGDAAMFVAEAENAAAIGFWDPVYIHRAGLAHQRAGAMDQALAYYEQVDVRGYGLFDSAYSAAMALQDNEPGEALRWYQRTVELEPNHPAVLRDAAAFFVAADRPGDAEPLIARLLQQDPQDAEAQRLQEELGA